MLIIVGLACTSSRGQSETLQQSAPPSSGSSSESQLIEHVTPRRDSTGPAPARFEWTAIDDANEYAIGMWNEADTMVWRQSGLAEPAVEFPEDNPLEPGTYYWSVTALRDGQPIAHSGLSAFVVMPDGEHTVR
jgi:hypothetical protein